MHKFKIGDKVEIRQKEEIEPSWDWDEFAMCEFCGAETEITKIIEVEERDNRRHTYYLLAADRGKYMWTDDMLKPAAEDSVKITLDDFVKRMHIPVLPTTLSCGCEELCEPMDKGMLAWSLYDFLEDSGIGRVVGEFTLNVSDDDDELHATAELEGGRLMTMEVLGVVD